MTSRTRVFALVAVAIVLLLGFFVLLGKDSDEKIDPERDIPPPSPNEIAPNDDPLTEDDDPEPPTAFLKTKPAIPTRDDNDERMNDPLERGEAAELGAPESGEPGDTATTTTSSQADPFQVDANEQRTIWTADREGIRGAVNESKGDIKDCYTEWLKLAPEMRGKLAISFSIEAIEGEALAKVTEVKIGESNLDHVFMEGCVQSVFSSLRFHPPSGGKVSVTYPMRFESNADGDGGI